MNIDPKATWVGRFPCGCVCTLTAVGMPDQYKELAKLEKAGIEVTREDDDRSVELWAKCKRGLKFHKCDHKAEPTPNQGGQMELLK